MKIHIKFIFLILAFKAVNKSAHTPFCPQVHMLFLPILTLSCSFCVSPTQDFVLGFLPTPGLPTSVVCMCIYSTYCYILYIYILSYAYIKCDLPFNSSLNWHLSPKAKAPLLPLLPLWYMNLSLNETFACALCNSEKGLHLFFLNYHVCLKWHVYDKA